MTEVTEAQGGDNGGGMDNYRVNRVNRAIWITI